MKILLVEDDAMLGASLKAALEKDYHTVDWESRGDKVNQRLPAGAYDLLILDLGLPGKDGMSILTEARRAGQALPVLILTARDSLDDRVRGLDAGADDYLLKPFDLEELSARIRALGRRRTTQAATTLSHGALSLEPATGIVRFAGKAISLSRREFMLLEVLVKRPGQIFTRQQLEESLYGWDDDIGSNTVEVHVHHLRKKLDNRVITTVRGLGYRLGDAL